MRRFHFLRGLGRLAPGVTLAQAQREMDGIAQQLEQTYPENETWKLRLVPYREDRRRRRGPDAHRAAGRGRPRAAHRLRQRREPAARARDGAQRRDGDPHGARRVASRGSSGNCSPRASCSAWLPGRRSRARLLPRRGRPRRGCGHRAAARRARTRPDGVALHVRAVARAPASCSGWRPRCRRRRAAWRPR